MKGTKWPLNDEHVFSKNGNVQLQLLDDLSVVLGVGVVPWEYVSPKGVDTVVRVSFTIDAVDGEDDVLIFQGMLVQRVVRIE